MEKKHQTPRKYGPTIAEHIAMKDMGELFGFRLMGTMDEYIVRAIELRLNQFVGGVTAGLTRFIDEVAKESVKNAVAEEIKRAAPFAGTAPAPIVANKERTIPEEIVADPEPIFNDDPVVIEQDFIIPRGHSGYIDWAGTGRGMHKKNRSFTDA